MHAIGRVCLQLRLFNRVINKSLISNTLALAAAVTHGTALLIDVGSQSGHLTHAVESEEGILEVCL